MKLTPEQRQMVEENMGLAKYAANKYKYNGVLDFNELLSAALEGLTIAACNHDTQRKAKFPTYASRIIKYHVLNEIYAYRKQRQIQQTLFHSHIELSDILEGDINPDIDKKLQLIIQYLRDFNGSQREKASVITWVRNPYLSQTEIAQKTGVCQKTVSTAISRFRQQLQRAS